MAGLAVTALIAGCGAGGGGGTTQSNSGAGATPAPTPTPSGVGLGLGAQGSGGNSGRAAGKISKGSVGSVVQGHVGQITNTKTGSVTHVSINQVLSKQAINRAKQQAEQKLIAAENAAKEAAQDAAQQAAQQKAASQKAAKTTQTPPPPTVSSPPHRTTPAHQPSGPQKTTVRTVTKTQVQTVVHTVTTTVPPKVPAGAFMPSKHPVLAQASFTVAGGNVACQMSTGGVRCGILRRVWAAPVQPASCKSSWGDTIALQRQGLPQFVCGGSDPMSGGAKVIPVGWDDKVANFICEVRSFGVDCFSPGNSGFILSRTGYAFY